MTNENNDPCTAETIPAPAGFVPPIMASRWAELPFAPQVCVAPTMPCVAPAPGDSLTSLEYEYLHADCDYDWGTWVLLKTGRTIEQHESARVAKLKV